MDNGRINATKHILLLHLKGEGPSWLAV